MLDDSQLRKVRALVEMTRSDSDNEALMAIRHANRMCKAGGVSLVEALSAGAAASIDLERMTKAMAEEFERGKAAGHKEALYTKKTNTPPATISDLPWKPMQQLCQQQDTYLSTRERDFIRDIGKWSHITTKQYSWLHSIYTRVKVCAPAPTARAYADL